MFVPLGQNLTGNRNPEFWRARFSFDEQVMSSLDLFGGERFTCWITHQIQQRTGVEKEHRCLSSHYASDNLGRRHHRAPSSRCVQRQAIPAIAFVPSDGLPECPYWQQSRSDATFMVSYGLLGRDAERLARKWRQMLPQAHCIVGE